MIRRSVRARERGKQLVRTVGGAAGRQGVVALTRLVGVPRLAAWAVASVADREQAISQITEELTPFRTVTAADIVGAYLEGYFLLGRSGSRPSAVFRRVGARGVIDAASARVPRKLRAELARTDLTVSDSMPLSPVIRACADRADSWIVEPVIEAWIRAESAGVVTTWTVNRSGEAVAGMWGIDIGRTYGIASMFHREAGAGTVALAALVDQLGSRWDLIDCGVLKPHFARFGAYSIPAAEFCSLVLDGLVGGQTRSCPVTVECGQPVGAR